MALSKTWTTVTPLSKLIALILFIALPFIGFLVGAYYQKSQDAINLVNNAPAKPLPTATPLQINPH